MTQDAFAFAVLAKAEPLPTHALEGLVAYKLKGHKASSSEVTGKGVKSVVVLGLLRKIPWLCKHEFTCSPHSAKPF